MLEASAFGETHDEGDQEEIGEVLQKSSNLFGITRRALNIAPLFDLFAVASF